MPTGYVVVTFFIALMLSYLVYALLHPERF
ncbi:MAG: potassium-transporting ATPase subunit F [Methanomassiliicoccales archaeon]